jgi:hypothetical protein
MALGTVSSGVWEPPAELLVYLESESDHGVVLIVGSTTHPLRGTA